MIYIIGRVQNIQKSKIKIMLCLKKNPDVTLIVLHVDLYVFASKLIKQSYVSNHYHEREKMQFCN